MGMPPTTRAATLVAALAAALALGFDRPAAATGGLFGVVSQSELEPADYRRMHDGGVASLRFRLDRRWVEAAPGARDWKYVDRLVGDAARHDIEALPFVYGSPGWVAEHHAAPPLRSRSDRRGWRSFLRALVRRYGPHGAFWEGWGDPGPIRTWQVWNEPNLPIYWRPRPDPREYARLMRISAGAVRSVDPAAELMLGGLAPTLKGMPTEEFLARLYAERGVRRAVDTVAVHPYAGRLETVRRRIRRVRDLVDRLDSARAPLAITEVGWASDGPSGHAMVRHPDGQARMVRRSFELFERKRRAWALDRVEWFAWRDATAAVERICDFCRFAGLFDAEGTAKRAWSAFRRFAHARRVEGGS
jgi:hypothetical protein